MAKQPSPNAPNVSSSGLVREKKGVWVNERTGKLTKKGLAFLESVRAHAAVDPFVEMEREFREFLREVGFPDDPRSNSGMAAEPKF